MNYASLRDKESPLVQAALERGCPVCGVQSGVQCRTITKPPRTLFEAFKQWVHFLRADGIKFEKSDWETK